MKSHNETRQFCKKKNFNDNEYKIKFTKSYDKSLEVSIGIYIIKIKYHHEKTQLFFCCLNVGRTKEHIQSNICVNFYIKKKTHDDRYKVIQGNNVRLQGLSIDRH